jgi:hypothetical protein
MERFDDVSVLASVDETPPPPRMPRRRRRALTAVVATVIAGGALTGAAVGLASEKQEPARSAAPAAGEDGWMKYSGGKHHRCHRHDGARPSQTSGFNY